MSATIPEVTHHTATVNGTELHYVTAGSNTDGPPVLLVHGFPESWWVFHRVIPVLAAAHRVVAVDLRGFGDSAAQAEPKDAATFADDLAELVDHLGSGPVHLVGQDVSGQVVYRVAASHPEAVRTLTLMESGLPGFGAEALGDVTHGGAWHVGVLAAPGIAEMLLAGRERTFIADYAIPSLVGSPTAFGDSDIDELARTFARPDGFGGAAGLYRSLLGDGEAVQSLAATPLTVPVLAVGGSSGEFTAAAMRQVADDVTSSVIDGIGHYVAMEAPDRLADVLSDFIAGHSGS